MGGGLGISLKFLHEILYDDGIAFSSDFFLRDLTFCVSSTIVSILSVLYCITFHTLI